MRTGEACHQEDIGRRRKYDDADSVKQNMMMMVMMMMMMMMGCRHPCCVVRL